MSAVQLPPVFQICIHTSGSISSKFHMYLTISHCGKGFTNLIMSVAICKQTLCHTDACQIPRLHSTNHRRIWKQNWCTHRRVKLKRGGCPFVLFGAQDITLLNFTYLSLQIGRLCSNMWTGHYVIISINKYDSKNCTTEVIICLFFFNLIKRWYDNCFDRLWCLFIFQTWSG